MVLECSFFNNTSNEYITTPNIEVQKKWTSVFYWTDYPLIPTLELFHARYLHFAETTDKFNGKPKLVGYVQFKTPVTLKTWKPSVLILPGRIREELI